MQPAMRILQNMPITPHTPTFPPLLHSLSISMCVCRYLSLPLSPYLSHPPTLQVNHFLDGFLEGKDTQGEPSTNISETSAGWVFLKYNLAKGQFFGIGIKYILDMHSQSSKRLLEILPPFLHQCSGQLQSGFSCSC